jgi:lipoprotein signal peptidase
LPLHVSVSCPSSEGLIWPRSDMVCVCVALLLKWNVGILFGVLAVMSPLFLVCYSFAIILWVLYTPHYISVTAKRKQIDITMLQIGARKINLE